ncbi:MAG: SET domain-containing protein-lysine N-methyltransferase [Alphaproteobacteria bacterium]|nr:SET domain-containing protein-lysine N-methyltransferase [Alphaproteobacteria bacterium]
MIHPHTRLAHIGEPIGFGVVATRPIPKGTIVWVRDPLDQRIPRDQARSLGPLFRDALRHYTFWEVERGDLILCWDHARYVNHSCEANCLGGGFEFEIAVRDIEPGEELTDDYATFGYASELPCQCGAPTCRGLVKRSDAMEMGPVWDARLIAAMARLSAVEQPLWPLVEDKARVDQALRDPRKTPLHRVA